MPRIEIHYFKSFSSIIYSKDINQVIFAVIYKKTQLKLPPQKPQNCTWSKLSKIALFDFTTSWKFIKQPGVILG